MEDKFINGLLNGIQEYQKNPFKYYYESDIKCMLYSKFSEQFFEDVELKVNKGYFKQDIIHIGQVATEYYYFIEGANGKSLPGNNKMDIAIINKDEIQDLSSINSHFDGNYTTEANWIQPIKYGIEIKFSSGNYFPDLSGLKRDIIKLMDYYCSFAKTKSLIGVAICFCHIVSDFKYNEYGFEKADMTDIDKFKRFLLNEETKYVSIVVMGDFIYYKDETMNNK